MTPNTDSPIEALLLKALDRRPKWRRLRGTMGKNEARDAAALLRKAGHRVTRIGMQRWRLDQREVTSRRLVLTAKEATHG